MNQQKNNDASQAMLKPATTIRQFIKDTNVDFLSKGTLALALSAVVFAICVLSLIFRGMNLGLDFTGGTVVEISYPRPVDLPAVRDVLAKTGFPGAQAQLFGSSTDVMIRIAPREGMNSVEISNRIMNALREAEGGGEVTMRRVEFVGPQVGSELIEDGALAMLYSLVGIFIYLVLRFEWRLALGAIMATVHDVVFTIGFFSLSWIEFDLTVLAAVLAVIGYSVNDTVVVMDRIRENFRRMRKGTPREIANAAINETLARTIMTSLTAFMAVVVLYFLGGPVMRGFSIAMIIGIIVGTYSTIYIASAGALVMGLKGADLLPKAKVEVDNQP